MLEKYSKKNSVLFLYSCSRAHEITSIYIHQPTLSFDEVITLLQRATSIVP